MPRPRAALVSAAVTLVVVTLLHALGAADALELPLRDAAVRALPEKPATATAVVAIDEASLRAVGPWPWPRATLAEVVGRAAGGGARGIILDVLLAEGRAGDQALAAALGRVPSVAAAVMDERGEWLAPSGAIAAAATAAHGNFELDHDGILRRLATTKQSRDRSLVALSLEAAAIVTRAPVPVGRSLAPAFRTRPRAIPQVSAAALLRGAGVARVLRGRLVFIGPTALALGDRVLTPVSRNHLPDPGVTVHAAAAESLIRGELVRVLPPLATGALAAGAVALIIAVRPRLTALLLMLLTTGGGLALLANGVAIPFVTLLTIVALTAAANEAWTIVHARRRSEVVAVRLTRDREDDVESKRRLAHELKTPLASMRGLSQLLAGFDLTEAERRRVASLLETEAGKLQSLVGVLLDLERLPLRDFHASSSVLNLGDLVAARLDLLRTVAGRPLLMTNDTPLFVRADAALLERVVDNLVGNALKYAPPPAPVTVRVLAGGGEAVIEVEDRGPGLGADRERLFGRFVRGAAAGGTEGLGLGLALVTEIARWHGGTVTADDAAGGGARFRVTLPLARARAEAS
jgi:signal transduction histidine kinase